ncbi:hypothetical protein THAOC_24703, partial [Thalassiosira oceanica]
MSAANASSGDDDRKLPAQGKTFTHKRKPPPGSEYSKLASDAEARVQMSRERATALNNYLNSMSGAITRHADGAASRGMSVDPRQRAASRGNDGTPGGTLGRRRNAPATPVGTAGVPVKRTKKQLRQMVKKGTPK